MVTIWKMTLKNSFCSGCCFFTFLAPKSDKFRYTEHTRGPESAVFCRANSTFPRRSVKTRSKKTQKNESKKLKKEGLDPSKWWFRQGKTLGYEKTRFFVQKQNCVFSIVFWGEGSGPKPCFLQGVRMIFLVKKSTLGSLLGRSKPDFGALVRERWRF